MNRDTAARAAVAGGADLTSDLADLKSDAGRDSRAKSTKFARPIAKRRDESPIGGFAYRIASAGGGLWLRV